jgi:hypothetical protein
MKIVTEQRNDIPVRNMKNGQIGVITQWSYCPQHIGTIIQMHHDNLVILGSYDGWSPTPKTENTRVRILPKGTLLEI